jgi:tetrahydromethanopterin S-methyltransferase subunit F
MTKIRNLPLLGPTMITCLASILLVAISIVRGGGDPLTLARIGTRFSEGNPEGTEGYDGQFVYYIARDPDPERVAPYLDVPAYRYQRILLPALARGLSFGNMDAIPWVLALLGIVSLTAGTWAAEQILLGWGVRRWYALVYGLWAGFLLAVILDLPEPLAYGLVAGGLLALERDKHLIGWCLLGLSVFAKEVAMLFILAGVLAYFFQRRWREMIALGMIGVVPFLVFQAWLWAIFGQPGIGSGGAMSTSFELIPYMGILRIGGESVSYLLAMLVVFGPAVILPSIWGVITSFKYWLDDERNVIVLGLFINAAIIAFLPFSTFRETGGILRFACGLVLAVLLFSARYRQRRALNYSILWIVLNVFLLK